MAATVRRAIIAAASAAAFLIPTVSGTAHAAAGGVPNTDQTEEQVAAGLMDTIEGNLVLDGLRPYVEWPDAGGANIE